MTKTLRISFMIASLTWAFGLQDAFAAEGTEKATEKAAEQKTETKSEAKPNKAKKEKKMTATNPHVVMETSLGNVEIELWADKAPISVENFLKYVDAGHYNGTIFHRVIKNFMIQGGGFSEDMKEKKTGAPIKNEARADVPNLNGTLAMARTGVVDSATAQFFINVKDNDFLNHRDESQAGFGYAVFGKVTSGLDVVQKIEKVATTHKGMYDDVPEKAVVIKSLHRKK